MMKIQELLETKLGKTIKEASNAEVYYALLSCRVSYLHFTMLF